MELWIDADGCPVTELAIHLARKYHVACTLVCDTAHQMDYPGVKIITVSKGADSADFALVNRVGRGDLVITQDYGLAAMCLSRGAVPIHQDGFLYTNENIDAMLFFRAATRKLRSSGSRMKGPKKRTREQNDAFSAALTHLLEAHS